MKFKIYSIILAFVFFIILTFGILYSSYVYIQEGILYVPKELIQQYKQKQTNTIKIKYEIHRQQELYKNLMSKNSFIKNNVINRKEINLYLKSLLKTINNLNIGNFTLLKTKQDETYINVIDVFIKVNTKVQYLKKYRKIIADIAGAIFKNVFYVSEMRYDDKQQILLIKLYKPIKDKK